MRRLTYDQFLEWAAYYKRNPWGQEREDMRFEVFRQRLLHAIGGKDSDKVPDWNFPYVTPELPLDELYRQFREADRRLVPKPGGGYELRD